MNLQDIKSLSVSEAEEVLRNKILELDLAIQLAEGDKFIDFTGGEDFSQLKNNLIPKIYGVEIDINSVTAQQTASGVILTGSEPFVCTSVAGYELIGVIGDSTPSLYTGGFIKSLNLNAESEIYFNGGSLVGRDIGWRLKDNGTGRIFSYVRREANGQDGPVPDGYLAGNMIKSGLAWGQEGPQSPLLLQEEMFFSANSSIEVEVISWSGKRTAITDKCLIYLIGYIIRRQ